MNRSKSVKSDVRLRYVKAARKNWLFGFQRGICSELNHLTRDEGAPRLSYETKFQKHLRPRPPYRDS